MSTSCVVVVKLCLITLFVGLVTAATSERNRDAMKLPNFRNRPQRVYRTTTEAAAVEEDEEEESDYQPTAQCPEPDGFFVHPEQCDKYYACSYGKHTEKLCPDGMVFNDYSSDQEKCDLPYNLDCSKRPKLQEPKPSPNCPRLNGYFAHKNANICDKFFYCVDGQSNMITCPAGLVFNAKTGICTWPDEAHKTGCSSEELFQFSCPKVDEGTAATHPRYADPEDCQFFYVCINGEQPRRNGCKLGQAFDDTTKRCDWARKIPECVDWYKGQLTDKQLDELENPPTTTTEKAKVSRRKQPIRRAQHQQHQQQQRRPTIADEETADAE